MCACDAHYDPNRHCTCQCPDHAARREEYARRFAPADQRKPTR